MSEIDFNEYTLELVLDHNEDVIGLILSKDHQDKYFYFEGEWRVSGDSVEEYLYEPGNTQIPFEEEEDKTIILNRFGSGEDDAGDPLPAALVLIGTSWENTLELI